MPSLYDSVSHRTIIIKLFTDKIYPRIVREWSISYVYIENN